MCHGWAGSCREGASCGPRRAGSCCMLRVRRAGGLRGWRNVGPRRGARGPRPMARPCAKVPRGFPSPSREWLPMLPVVEVADAAKEASLEGVWSFGGDYADIGSFPLDGDTVFGSHSDDADDVASYGAALVGKDGAEMLEQPSDDPLRYYDRRTVRATRNWRCGARLWWATPPRRSPTIGVFRRGTPKRARCARWVRRGTWTPTPRSRQVLKKVVGVFVLTLAIRNVMLPTSFSYVLLRLTQRHRQLSSAPAWNVAWASTSRAAPSVRTSPVSASHA